jgi:hypothetical protein
VTLALAAIGIGFGLVSGSLAIVFAGVSSTIDAAMTFLSLAVARLVLLEGSRRGRPDLNGGNGARSSSWQGGHSALSHGPLPLSLGSPSL